MPPRSLATHTLLHIGAITLLVASIGSFIAYHQMRAFLIERQTGELLRLNAVRAQKENTVFERATRHHQVLKAAFLDAYNSTSGSTVNGRFEQLVERNIDGCWRSRETGFDAEKDAGIWIDNDVVLNDELKWRVTVFQRLASEYGRAWRQDYLNTYFLAPENIGVPFWPDAPNIVRLLNAQSDVTQEEYFRVADANNNPQRATVWTGLYADSQTKVWMVSVETPIYVGEKHLATIGNDITMADVIARSSEVNDDGSYTALFRADGRLIAHPQYNESLLQSGQLLSIPRSGDASLIALYDSAMIAVRGNQIQYDEVLDAYVVVATLATPDWYFVRVVPRTVVMANVRVSAGVMLVLIFAMALLTYALLWWWVRREIARPIAQLTDALAHGVEPQELSRQREDEVGELARQFIRMHHDVTARDARLHEHVMQLQVQQLRLQQAQWQAALCSFEYDPIKAQLNLSDNFATLLRLPAIPTSLEQLLTLLNTAGLGDLVQAIERLSHDNNAFHLIAKNHHDEAVMSSWDCQGQREDNGCLRVVVQDISARQQIEAALRASEERFEIAFEAAPIGFAVVSESGRFMRVNPKLCELLGYRENELVGVSVLQITHPDDRTLTSDRIKQFQTNTASTQQFEKRYMRKNGDIVWALVSSNVQRDHETGASYFLTQVVDITSHKHAEQELNRLAFHDSLTGLPNRALFLQLLRQSVQRVQRRPHPPFAVLFLDLDGFKAINDNLGHLVGDELLLSVAGRLQHTLRPGDTVARFGGDEFCVLIDAVHQEDELNRVAERILIAVNEPVFIGHEAVNVSTSIGIVISSPAVTRAEDYLRDADTAMYHAKKAGRNQYAHFKSSMLTENAQRLRGENWLREALVNREIRPAYQLILDAQHHRVAAVEALARWHHPQRGELTAVQFMTMADESNMSALIDFAIIEQGLADLVSWRQTTSFTQLQLSWNVSVATFADRQLAARLAVLLTQHGLTGEALVIELNETALIHDPEQTLLQMQRLRELGIAIHLDDFGTGYSSLSYLHRFPLQNIKIDRSFIARLNDSGRDRSIVEGIVMMVRRLDIGVTAEGVESSALLNTLIAMGVTHVQGAVVADVVDAVSVHTQLMTQAKPCLSALLPYPER